MEPLDLGPEFRPRSTPQREIDDYRHALPKGVLPTSVRLLGCDGHLLIGRHFDWKTVPSQAQIRLFKEAVALGEHPDAPGSVTVACFWGVPGLNVGRKMIVFDHMGVTETPAANDDIIQSSIRHWWLDRGGRA